MMLTIYKKQTNIKKTKKETIKTILFFVAMAFAVVAIITSYNHLFIITLSLFVLRLFIKSEKEIRYEPTDEYIIKEENDYEDTIVT